MQTLSFDFNHTKNGSDTVMRIVLLLCMVWFITVLLAALSGGFEMAVGEPPAAILFAVIAPVVMFAVSYMTISVFRDWVLMLDMRQRILLHSWRMVGIGFVFLYFLYFYGQLPALFPCPPISGMLLLLPALSFWILHCSKMHRQFPVEKFFMEYLLSAGFYYCCFYGFGNPHQ